MSFGYTTTSSTIAHKHSNAAGDGGSLDGTTLISNIPLFALVIS